jgi:hypothetical protein
MLRVAPVSKNREVGEKKVFCKESSDEWRLSRRPDCLRRFTARRRRAAQRNKTYSLRSSASLRLCVFFFAAEAHGESWICLMGRHAP